MPEKFHLSLLLWPGSKSETSVINAQTGAPIPFEWVDHDTLAIDAAFAEVAAPVYTPERGPGPADFQS